MSKQLNYESDSMHKPSTFHLLHKKWNVLRTGVLWAQRLKSVKNTKSTDMTYTQFNNRSYNCSFSNPNSIVEDSNINNNSNCNNSSSNINVTTYNYTPQRTLSSITKLNDKDYDYIDKLQKRNTVIKHCSSAKRLAK